MNKEDVIAAVRMKLQSKISQLEQLIAEIRTSNTETKSSMGDKYETGREMLQQEINQLQMQLKSAADQLQQLNEMPCRVCTKAVNGALVKTCSGVFLIGVSAGEIAVDGQKVIAVSPDAPLAKAMYGKAEGGDFVLNGNLYRVEQIT